MTITNGGVIRVVNSVLDNVTTQIGHCKFNSVSSSSDKGTLLSWAVANGAIAVACMLVPHVGTLLKVAAYVPLLSVIYCWPGRVFTVDIGPVEPFRRLPLPINLIAAAQS